MVSRCHHSIAVASTHSMVGLVEVEVFQFLVWSFLSNPAESHAPMWILVLCQAAVQMPSSNDMDAVCDVLSIGEANPHVHDLELSA